MKKHLYHKNPGNETTPKPSDKDIYAALKFIFEDKPEKVLPSNAVLHNQWKPFCKAVC